MPEVPLPLVPPVGVGRPQGPAGKASVDPEPSHWLVRTGQDQSLQLHPSPYQAHLQLGFLPAGLYLGTASRGWLGLGMTKAVEWV